MTAIRNGTEGPPSLSKFALEQQFWQRCGIRLDPRPLLDRPVQEVEDYLVYVQMICREEDAQRRRQSRGR